MKTNPLTTKPQTPAELSCTELLGCPWCGNQPIGHAMRYRNTGRVFGHKIRCETCNYERTITPPCWTEGKEQDVMDAAKVQLVEWWNSRKHPNESSSPATPEASGGAERKHGS